MSSTDSNYEDEPEDISFGAVYIKDPQKRRKCPLCNQNLYLYNLNYEEMMLMCENLDCDFPFGYEAMQVVLDESELKDAPLPATDNFVMYPVGGVTAPIPSNTTTSFLQTSCLSDIDQLSLAESDVSKQEILSVRLSKQSKQRKQRKVLTKDIDNNVKKMKRLSNEMFQISSENCNQRIRKEKWLNNLMMWQEQSGKKLLKDEEMKSLKKNEPEFALGELKITVDSDAGMPSLDIQIVNK